MANAYKFVDLINNVANPPVKNTEYCNINDLEVTPLRATDILIQPSESNFEPYVPESKTHTVTIYYPTIMRLTYEGTVLQKTIQTGLAKSKIIVPEEQDGNKYYPIITYTPKGRTNHFENSTSAIALDNITRDTAITLYYVYDFKILANDNIDYITVNESTDTVLPYEYSSTAKKIKVQFHVAEGYQISSVTGTSCKAVSTGSNDIYEIEYSGDGTQVGIVNVTTIEKQAEISYHNVKITGLQHANVVYNSATVDEINGSATIANVASGTTLSLTINSDTNYELSKITIDNSATSYSLTSKEITVTVNNSDVEIGVQTIIKKVSLTISKNDYVSSVTINGEAITPTASKTVLIDANAQSTIVFNFDSTLYKLTAVSATSGTLTKSNETTYILGTDDTTENITLNYTVSLVEKKTVTFQNASNVTIKKGSNILDTASGAYSEQFTSGSNVTYTITANGNYTLNSVTITPTKSNYSYVNGTLTITSIADDITVQISTSAQQELSRIMLELVNEDGNVIGASIGTLPNRKDFNQSAMEKSLTGEAIDLFYNTPQPFSISTTSGKVVKSVTCSEGGAVFGNLTDGFTFKLTSKAIATITITVVTADESETPTPTTTYEVKFKGAENALIYSGNTLLPYSVVGADTVYTLENVTSGDTASVIVTLADTDKYEFYAIPTATGYAISWNPTTGALSIQNVTSNISVQLYIREKIEPDNDWDGSATFYADNSKYSTSIYWAKGSNGYEYSKTLSGTGFLAVTTAWWICLDYKRNCKYLIETSYTNVKKIYLYYSTTSKTASAIGQAINQRIELDSTQFKKVDKGYEIPAKYISQSDNYKYIYLAFYRNKDSTQRFVITDVKYAYSNLSTDSVFSSSGGYRSTSISNFQFINECDPTAQTIPYSSLSFDVYDRDNQFDISVLNQIKKDTTDNVYVKGTPYNIYTLSAAVTEDRNLTNEDYYIVQIGRMFLNNITHDNDYATFNFIGIIEKYDNIYLSSAEKRLSSYWRKTNVREYVKQLFGNDVDETNIPKHFVSLTPFEDESKAEILRTLCDYCNMIMFEGSDGKVHFSTNVTASTPITFEGMTSPYKLTLNNCFNFPTFEQGNDQYDSASIQISKRLKNSAKKIFDSTDFLMLVKTVEPSESENWQDDSDWQILIRESGDNTYYYDVDGREYMVGSDSSTSDENVDFFQIVNTYGEIKYIKFEFEFKNPVTDVRFFSSSLLENTTPVNGMDVDTFKKYFCGSLHSFFFDWLGESTVNGVNFYLSEKRFELFAKFPISANPNYGVSTLNRYIMNYGYIDVYSPNAIYLGVPSDVLLKYSDSDAPETIDYAEVLFDLYLSVWFTIMNSTAKEITTTERTYNYKPFQISKNTFKGNNDLVDSISDAIWYSSIGLQKLNNDAVVATIEDWKGNGLTELTDNILFEQSTGRELERKYGKFYCGKIKKIAYDFSGALSVDTTLSLSPTAYYESQNTGDLVAVFPSNSTTFTNGKVDFVKKIT